MIMKDPVWSSFFSVHAESLPARRGESRQGKSALLLGGVYIVKPEKKK